MKHRNLMTYLVIVGLILGALAGEWFHRRSAGVANAAALVERHDQILMLLAEEDIQLDRERIQALQTELESIRAQAAPVLAERTFLKFAGYIGSDIFMGLLKMLIMPLIVSSVIVGVTSAGDFSKLGKLAGRTFLYFFATMFIAVIIGMITVSTIQPGVDFFAGERGEEERLAYLELGQERRQEMAMRQQASGIEAPKTVVDALMGIVKRMIPTNPVADIANANTLPVIVFSIFFGIVLSMIGNRGKILVDFMRAVMDVMIQMTHYVLWLAPIGVFFLVARAVAGIGLEQFASKIGLYMVTVITALMTHAVIILPLVLILFARISPLKYLIAMKDALLLAFSTASSSATLPVTIDCARTRGGCSRRASGFVLPLGATINMDGTAMYEAVAVLFLAQAFTGGTLPLDEKVILALTATLAGVGAAGIPEAGLTTMIIVITAVNAGGTIYIPPAAIGLILGVDRLLDMTRTMINVWGDAIGAKILSRYEDDAEQLEEEPDLEPAA